MKRCGSLARSSASSTISCRTPASRALIDGQQVAIFRVGEQRLRARQLRSGTAARTCCRAASSATCRASWSSPRRSTSITSACSPAAASKIRSCRSRAYPARVTDGRVWVKSRAAARAATRQAQARRRRQRHGRHAGRRRAARDRAEGLRHHRLRRRAASATTTASCCRRVLAGEKTRRRHHPQSARVVPRQRHHAARGRSGGRASIGVRRVVRSAAASKRPTTGCCSPPARSPIMLPVPGNDLPGVVTFRDLQDVDAMLAAARAHKQGGRHRRRPAGARSRERAAQAGHGCDGRAHLLDTLMERQLDRAAAALLQESLERRGLQVPHASEDGGASLATDRARHAACGSTTAASSTADLVVMAAGIRPNIELARERGPALRARRARRRHACRRSIRASTRWANACSTATAPMAWSRRCGSRRGSARRIWPRSASAAIAARCCRRSSRSRGIDLFSAGDFVGGAGSEALVLRMRSAASTSDS